MKMTKNIKKIQKDTINGCVYVEKYHNFKKLCIAYNIGQRIFVTRGYEK